MPETEPTHSEYLILKDMRESIAPVKMNNDNPDITKYWELVRHGYVNNLVGMWSCDWVFDLTEKAVDYLEKTQNAP